MLFVRRYLVDRYEIKQLVGYQYVEGDVLWTRRNTIRYPVLCTIAGLAAGLFGIGGGIVKGPLMLEMGVLPEVASVTSATMILFTSSGGLSCVSFLTGFVKFHVQQRFRTSCLVILISRTLV